jgi:hypothetical protein
MLFKGTVKQGTLDLIYRLMQAQLSWFFIGKKCLQCIIHLLFIRGNQDRFFIRPYNLSIMLHLGF